MCACFCLNLNHLQLQTTHFHGHKEKTKLSLFAQTKSYLEKVTYRRFCVTVCFNFMKKKKYVSTSLATPNSQRSSKSNCYHGLQISSIFMPGVGYLDSKLKKKMTIMLGIVHILNGRNTGFIL